MQRFCSRFSVTKIEYFLNVSVSISVARPNNMCHVVHVFASLNSDALYVSMI